MYRSLLDYPADAAPAGWYPSVKVAGAWRWWDGVNFTQDHRWDADSGSWLKTDHHRKHLRQAVRYLVLGYLMFVTGVVIWLFTDPADPNIVRSVLLTAGGSTVISSSVALYRALR